AHRARIAVWQNRLRPVRRIRDRLERADDAVDRFVPRDPAKLPRSLGAGSQQRILQAVRMIDAFEVARHLLAQKAVGERMILIRLQLDGSAILDGDDHAARIGTIMRTDGTNGSRFAHCDPPGDAVILSCDTGRDTPNSHARLAFAPSLAFA